MELISIEGLTKKSLPFEETLVIPLGDIQLQQNRDAVDIKGLKRAVDFGVAHNAWFLGMGDYIDLESPSNRRALMQSGVYDSVVDALDAKAEELEDELKDILAPTVGRWLGLLEGHHYHVHQDGTTSDTRLAHFLKAPFLGTSAYVNLSFTSNKHTIHHNIWCHHGRAGGKLLSTPLNQLEQLTKGFDADTYLVGHHHKAVHGVSSRVYPLFVGRTEPTLHHKDIHLACTGSFLKGYVERHKVDGRSSGLYAERGMMNPLALRSLRIWFRPRWEGSKSGNPRLDVTIEA